MKDIFAELTWRGLLNQSTDDKNLAAWLLEKPRTVYIGFDPTADSLHVGSPAAGDDAAALPAGGPPPHRPGGRGHRHDRRSQRQECRAQPALGGGPPGQRGRHGRQLTQFLDFGGGSNSALLVNNYDWMGRFSYLEFLRDVGKHFPVNVMLGKDSVKSRLERTDSGLSYTEFSYMLLQAYDFVHLFDTYGCELQAGGSDQWGNITAGIDLARRMRSALIFTASPVRSSPRATAPRWARPRAAPCGWIRRRTSPYQFYQYWINVADADVGKCLRFLTDLEREEIEAVEAVHAAAPEKREAQKRMASELTRLVHGEAGLASAQRATSVLFGAEIVDLNDAELTEIFADVPSSELSRDRLAGEGLPIVDALVESGLAKSKGEARRTLAQGGAYLNNRRVDNPDQKLGLDALASETVLVLRAGKKNYALLKFRT